MALKILPPEFAADGEKLLTVNTHNAVVPSYCNLVLNWPALVTKP